jgi:serine/threonine protein kinase/WD40 repeat protein
MAWNPQVNEMFLKALELESTEERRSYLDAACSGDQRLQVEALLSASEKAGGFLESPLAAVAETVVASGCPEQNGTFIGPYKLMEQIGEGGMGLVFVAEQQEPVRRKVALKIVKPGMDTRQVVARFEAERQALALMDHPNIAKVFDGGETAGGRPYFVMELVKGVPITDYCDQNQVPIRERLELFFHVCQAVQHAHQKGIIHRDIKPSNVLIMSQDGTPLVKVIDFGVAKAVGQQLTDKTIYTQFTQLLGTPLYMSPEQAGQSGVDVDTRTDIYALGVLLYELLTGTTPFDRERLCRVGYDQIRQIIREEEPPKPSTRISTLGIAAATISTQRQSDPQRLSRLFRAELDWIVMKCLEKDRNRRYETANGLARDIQRYLHDEPVQACPPSLGYRLVKISRKHGRLLATAAAFAMLLMTVAAVASLSAWRLSKEQDATSQQLLETVKAQDQTKRELYRSLVAQARANRLSRSTGRRVRSLDLLADATRLAKELQLPEDDFLELRNETIACLPLVDLRVARRWEGHPAGTLHFAFDANLDRYARFDHLKNVASVRRVADDSVVCRIAEFSRSVEPWVVLSPDGRFLGCTDSSCCKVWRVTSQGAQLLPRMPGNYLGFSPDSKLLAISREDGVISIYRLPSGELFKQWQTGPSASVLRFHPEKPQLAVRNSGKITVFDMDTGNKLAEFRCIGTKWDDLEWHPNGKWLAEAGADRCIHIRDAYTGMSLGRLVGHTYDGIRMAFNSAGDLLASTCWDRTLRLWDVGTGQELFKTSWEPGALRSLRFSRDGRRLAADVADHQLRLWELIPACGYQHLVREPHLGKTEYHGCAVSTRHPLLAVAREGGVGLWELPGGRPVGFLSIGTYHGVAFEPSGALLTSGFGAQRRWPIEAVGPQGTLRIGPPQLLPFPASGGELATSRDGRVMASAQRWGALVRHADLGDKLIRLAPQYDVRLVAVSPEGEWVATGSHSATDVYVKVWKARNGRRVADLPVEGSSLVGFSPDGRWLVTTGGDCRLWEVGTWREGPKIGGSGAFAFSPDSKVLAVETGSGVVRLVDPDAGREYARLEDPNQDRAAYLTFSQDGSQLFASSHGTSAVHVWDLRAIRKELTRCELDWDLPAYPPVELKHEAPLRVTVVSPEVALAHINSGQWDEAAGDYAMMAEANPDEHSYWYQSAPLCLQTGNVEGYRRICREMLKRFGNTDQPHVAERMAKTCSLAPEAVSDFAQVLKLADRAVTGTQKHPYYRWFMLAKGLAEYRAGHYAAAVDWLNRFSPQTGGGHCDATAFAVLGMAKHRLVLAPATDPTRLAEKARAALGHAQAILAEKMPDPSEGRPFDYYFHDWLHARILVHEAEMLLGK